MRRTFSLIVVAVLAAAVALATGPPASATICLLDAFLPITMHQYYAATSLYPGRYPATQWRVRVLPSSFSARTTVTSFVINGSDCDVLHGAISSTATLALSPLVSTSVAWIDAGAMSTELSSVEAHPAFNRVSPTADVGTRAVAVFARAMNWTTVAVLCDNVAVGRGLAETFSSSFTHMGGAVTLSRCVEADSTVAEINAVLDGVEDHDGSRVLFLAASRQNAQLDPLYTLIASRRMHERWTIVLSGGSCVPNILALFPGGLCAAAEPDESYTNDFLPSYRSRDVVATGERDAFLSTGRSADYYDSQVAVSDPFGAFGVDSVRMAMEAVSTFHNRNATAYPTMAEYVRSVQFDGVSGYIELLPDGDRRDAQFSFYNGQPNPAYDGTNATDRAVSVQIGSMRRGTFSRAPTPAGQAGLIYWYYGAYSDIPPSSVPPADDEELPVMPTWVIVVIIVAAVSLVVIAAIALATRSGASGPDYSHCPVDPKEPLVVFFVAVHGLPFLWDACESESVNEALDRVAKFVRTAVRKHKCHEARRLDAGTFMIVAKTPEAALHCAAAIAKNVNVEFKWSDILRPSPHLAAHINDTNADTRSETSRRSSRLSDRSSQRRRRTRKSHNHAEAQPTRSSSVPRPSQQHHHHHAAPGTGSVNELIGNVGEAAALRAGRLQLRVCVGAAYGFANIDFDPEHHILAYHGPLLDEAANVADAAVGGQIVVTPHFVDAIDEAGATVPGHFTVFRDVASVLATAVPSPGLTAAQTGGHRDTTAARAITITLRTFMPAHYAIASEVQCDIEEEVERADRRMLSAQASEQGSELGGGADGHAGGQRTAGSILGALSSAATGAAPRHVGVIVIDIPALADTRDRSGPDHARFCLRVIADIASVAAAHRSHVHDVIGTRIVVTVNAVGDKRVAQPAIVAIDAALRLSQQVCRVNRDLLAASRRSGACSIGVAAGIATAGVAERTPAGGAGANASKPAEVVVATGSLVRSATIAQGASRELRLPLVVFGIDAAEFRSRFFAVTVDAAAPRRDSRRAAPVVAVTAAKDDAAEQEWLYIVGDADVLAPPAPGEAPCPEARWAALLQKCNGAVASGNNNVVSPAEGASAPALVGPPAKQVAEETNLPLPHAVRSDNEEEDEPQAPAEQATADAANAPASNPAMDSPAAAQANDSPGLSSNPSGAATQTDTGKALLAGDERLKAAEKHPAFPMYANERHVVYAAASVT